MGYINCNEYVGSFPIEYIDYVKDTAKDMGIPITSVKITSSAYQVFSNSVENARRLLMALNKTSRGN